MGGTTFRQQWLADQEFEVGRRLEKASLVVEINFDEDELRRVQDGYGQRASELLRLGAPHAEIVSEMPALTLAILVGQAALGYEQNRYWDEFFARLDLERDQRFEHALRHSLDRLLGRFGLRRFPELKNEYVQVLALHAAFPVYCMRDILDLLEERMVAGTEVTGGAIIEWLREPGKKYRMNTLDVPVRNFVLHGGQLAVDILNRIIEFVEFTTENTEWAASEINLETSTTGLPTLLLDTLIDLLKERPFGSGPRPAAPRVRRRRRPTLAYLPLDRQVVVEVPYPDIAPDVPWRLSFDGVGREALAEPGWGVRADEEHPPTAVPVPGPVREITLQHPASEESATVTVVDKDDPLLIFDADGRWVPRHTMLPRECVLAVYPSDAQVVDAGTDMTLMPTVGVETPVGWTGWSAVELDLSTCRSIVLTRKGRRSLGGVRSVRDTTAPSFEHGEPIDGVQTLNGLTVYGSRPEVTLPANPGSQPIPWRVRAKRPDSTTWIVDTEIDGTDEDIAVDPFEHIDDAMLGMFEIQVSGPIGADIRQQVFLAEGIFVDYSRPFRFPATGGLIPVVATIGSEWDLDVPHPRVDFGAGDRDKLITVTQGERAYRLRLTPPYLQMRADRIGAPAQWRTAAAVLTPTELDEHRHIALQAPMVEAAVFQLEDMSGHRIKDVTPDTPHYEYFQAPSRVFFDVARDLGPCRIVALVDDEHGRTVKVVLVHVRPAALCAGITVSDGTLVLDDPADEEDLAVNVWARTAPWSKVQTLRVVDGCATLPDSHVDAGPLLVQVFVDDPWTTLTPPSWPGDSAFEVEQAGWMHDLSHERDNLSRFLAGAGPAPADAVSMPEVWAAFAVLPQDSEDTHTQQLRSALGRILAENPRSALEALGNSIIPLPEMMAMLIRTGLVYESYAADYTLNILHPNPWVGCMIEIADLPSLYARRNYVAGERIETIDYLEHKGGATLMEVLSRGKSADLYSGVFDRGTVQFAAMPASQVEAIIEHARLVPGALLDEDTRVSAAIDAFHTRDEWMERGASTSFVSAAVRSLDVIRRTRGPIYREVAARSETLDGVDTTRNQWMFLTLQSLTFAVLARMRARGMLRYPPVTADFEEQWAVMAQLCPRLVMSDLLIAEAFVTYARHGNLIGDI